MIDILHAAHLACVAAAGLLFGWRGIRMWQDDPVEALVWRRIVPDSVDTLLLISGIGLVMSTRQYPFEANWITVKLALVLCYIGLGFVAFGASRRSARKRAAWLAGLFLFVVIGWLGRTHGRGLL